MGKVIEARVISNSWDDVAKTIMLIKFVKTISLKKIDVIISL